jgi:hypothetical protein
MSEKPFRLEVYDPDVDGEWELFSTHVNEGDARIEREFVFADDSAHGRHNEFRINHNGVIIPLY